MDEFKNVTKEDIIVFQEIFNDLLCRLNVSKSELGRLLGVSRQHIENLAHKRHPMNKMQCIAINSILKELKCREYLLYYEQLVNEYEEIKMHS